MAAVPGFNHPATGGDWVFPIATHQPAFASVPSVILSKNRIKPNQAQSSLIKPDRAKLS
jgi:hypothetical protein